MERISIQSKQARQKYFSGVVDLNYFEHQGSIFYSVGVVGKGMYNKLATAPVIRRIKPINDSTPANNLEIYNLIQAMNVSWVRYKRLTVLPFPIKLINEWWQRKNY